MSYSEGEDYESDYDDGSYRNGWSDILQPQHYDSDGEQDFEDDQQEEYNPQHDNDRDYYNHAPSRQVEYDQHLISPRRQDQTTSVPTPYAYTQRQQQTQPQPYTSSRQVQQKPEQPRQSQQQQSYTPEQRNYTAPLRQQQQQQHRETPSRMYDNNPFANTRLTGQRSYYGSSQ